MAQLTSICVYCGSADGTRQDYRDAAEKLGSLMARSGIRLVYGGGSVGLMGILARSVLSHGGKVSGIIPQFLRDREVMLAEVSDLTVTDDMHARKRRMFEEADCFVALPGGIGTLEEIVEMMTWAQLRQHRKPILLADINGFWQPLIALLAHMNAEGFLHKDFLPGGGSVAYQTVRSVEEIIPALKDAMKEIPREELATNGARKM
jgi:uncharacterized protein (TIGR00730 family)